MAELLNPCIWFQKRCEWYASLGGDIKKKKKKTGVFLLSISPQWSPFHPALREKMREPEDPASVSSPGTRQGTPNKVSCLRMDRGS